VHKVHYGANIAEYGVTDKIGTAHFSDVRFPVMSNTGHAGDADKCYMGHVQGAEAVFPIGLNPVTAPQGLMTPLPPTKDASTACYPCRTRRKSCCSAVADGTTAATTAATPSLIRCTRTSATATRSSARSCAAIGWAWRSASTGRPKSPTESSCREITSRCSD